jgi:hypothetical protein
MLHNVTEFRKHTILAADRTIGDIKGSCAVGILPPRDRLPSRCHSNAGENSIADEYSKS